MSSSRAIKVSGTVAGRELVSNVSMLVDPDRERPLVSQSLALAAELPGTIVKCDVFDEGVPRFEALTMRIGAIRLNNHQHPEILEVLVPLPDALLPEGIDLVLGGQFVRNAGLRLAGLAPQPSMTNLEFDRLTIRLRRIVAQCPSIQAEVGKADKTK